MLAGQSAPRNPNLRLTTERRVDSPVEWYGPARLVGKIERDRFPQSLNDLPVLLPTAHSALRPTLGHWFETQGLRPRIVGLMRGLRLLGSSDGVKKEIHAIRSRRGRHHRLVQKMMAGAGSTQAHDESLASSPSPTS